MMDLLDGFQDFRRRQVLDQVAVGAGFQRLEHPPAVLFDGEHDDLQLRQAFLEPANALDAGHPRQIDIHQDDIGRLARNLPRRFLSRRANVSARKTR